jgi:hypothetical protein
VPKKLELKYGWKGLEIRKNFSYINFSRFEMEFELKFKEVSMSWNSLEKSLKNLGTLDFDEIWPASSWLHLIARKNQIPSKEDQKLNSTQKGNFIDFMIVWILNFIFEFRLSI